MPTCPNCKNELEVEEGRFADVHRCDNCRFEGIESPLAVIMRAIEKKYDNVR